MFRCTYKWSFLSNKTKGLTHVKSDSLTIDGDVRPDVLAL